jgi:sulfotransferase
MDNMNVICGLPRSGSTLLCNILNQNPKFWASSTSTLPQLLGTSINVWSNSLEMKGELVTDREGTEKKLHRSLKAFCDAWHERSDGRTVIFEIQGMVS